MLEVFSLTMQSEFLGAMIRWLLEELQEFHFGFSIQPWLLSLEHYTACKGQFRTRKYLSIIENCLSVIQYQTNQCNNLYK